MSKQPTHVHLVYIGNDRFQLTITIIDQSNPLIEVMTFGDLQQSIRKMKAGAKTIRFAKSTIVCKNMPLDMMREYFEKVYDHYVRAKAQGKDLDAELRKLNRPDLTDGSGGLSLN